MAKPINKTCTFCHSQISMDIEPVFCPYCGKKLIADKVSIAHSTQNHLSTEVTDESQQTDTIISDNPDATLCECICNNCKQIALINISKKEAFCQHCGKKLMEKGELINSVPKDMKAFWQIHKKKLKIAAIAVFAFFCVMIVACGAISEKSGNRSKIKETETAATEATNLISKISPKMYSDLDLEKDETKTVEFSVYCDGSITEDDISVEIADTSIADVSDVVMEENILSYSVTVSVIGKKAGTTTLTITSKDGKVQSKAVNLSVSGITKISFNDTNVNLTIGDSTTVSALIVPSGITKDEFTVTATDSAIIGISNIQLNDEEEDARLTFTATGLSKGNTTIKIQSTYNDEYALTYVTVADRPTEAPTEKPTEKPVEKPADNNSGQSNTAQQNISVYNDDYSDTTVYITDTGTKYHNSGCRFLKDSQYAISLDEAIAQGYEPCQVCH